MAWNLKGTHAQAGDIAQLVGQRHKNFLFTLTPDAVLHTHQGMVQHNDLIGLSWGSQVFTHTGSPFVLLQPGLADILRETKRRTQILYPKDIGFILVMMNIGPGQHILEAGTGSGAFTAALAYAVGTQGHISTYEVRPEFQKLAITNLQRLGLTDRITFHLGDIADGFHETDADAVFLDLPNPYDYMVQVRNALKPGGFFGTILPTTNQVSLLLDALRKNQFAFIEVCETFLRYYRPDATKLRPTDRMVAHTGFLIFARKIQTAETFPLEEEVEIEPE